MATLMESTPARGYWFRDHRLAWILWVVFGVVIAGVTVTKLDMVQLSSGDRVVGRVKVDNASEVVVRLGGGLGASEDGQERRIPRGEVANVFRLGDRSVTPEYRRAAELWWACKPLYTEGIHGFLYFPQSAVAYAPIAALPAWVGEPLWRIISIGIVALGVWRLCVRATPGSGTDSGRATLFTLATMLCIPACIGSAVNGQTNLIMGGLFALAAADLVVRRYWSAAAWVMMALVFKPVAIVVVLLMGAVYPRSIPRLALVGAGMGLLALVHPDPGYALAQCVACVDKMRSAATPEASVFLDQGLGGLLTSLNARPSDWVMTLIRATAALATLGACLWGRRVLREPGSAIMLLTLGTAYIVLMNPRTEGVSYAILGPAAGLWAAREWMARRWVWAGAMTALCLVLQFSRVLTGGSNYWVRPAFTLVLVGLACVELGGRRGWDVRGTGNRGHPQGPGPDTALP